MCCDGKNTPAQSQDLIWRECANDSWWAEGGVQEYLHFLDDVLVGVWSYEECPFVDVGGLVVFVWVAGADAVRVADIEAEGLNRCISAGRLLFCFTDGIESWIFGPQCSVEFHVDGCCCGGSTHWTIC